LPEFFVYAKILYHYFNTNIRDAMNSGDLWLNSDTTRLSEATHFPDKTLQHSFRLELAKLSLKASSLVLEVGFGNGHFQKWARKQGYQVYGLERASDLVSSLKEQGFSCLHVSESKELSSKKFDLVIAFDVLEHLGFEESIGNLREWREMLVEGGRILLRFPNGSSPFSGHYFWGDATHITLWTQSKLSDACDRAGLKIVAFRNPVMPLAGRGLPHVILRAFRKAAMYMIEFFLGIIIFTSRLPMQPNAIAVIDKKTSTTD
jgi:2-polyprenyl-3-methyl-5-hydroxy-6-metoxy-1,4-benzoquinol methylase